MAAYINKKHLDQKGYTYEYPRPAVTADCVIFGFDGNSLRILLVERGVEPYLGLWALPGGFMKMDETIEDCARRELFEETAVSDIYLEQFHTFSGVRRDPRGRVVTVAFIALIRPSDHNIIGGDDAANAAWFNADQLPPLAFDHLDIIKSGRRYLKDILTLRPAAFHLLNELFTIEELRRVYEVVNQTSYDRRNFQRKLMSTNLVEKVHEDNMSDVCCLSEQNSNVTSSKMHPRDKKGRRPNLFRLIGKNKSSESSDSDDTDDLDDNSIKRLFNF